MHKAHSDLSATRTCSELRAPLYSFSISGFYSLVSISAIPHVIHRIAWRTPAGSGSRYSFDRCQCPLNACINVVNDAESYVFKEVRRRPVPGGNRIAYISIPCT